MPSSKVKYFFCVDRYPDNYSFCFCTLKLGTIIISILQILGHLTLTLLVSKAFYIWNQITIFSLVLLVLNIIGYSIMLKVSFYRNKSHAKVGYYMVTLILFLDYAIIINIFAYYSYSMNLFSGFYGIIVLRFLLIAIYVNISLYLNLILFSFAESCSDMSNGIQSADNEYIPPDNSNHNPPNIDVVVAGGNRQNS